MRSVAHLVRRSSQALCASALTLITACAPTVHSPAPGAHLSAPAESASPGGSAPLALTPPTAARPASGLPGPAYWQQRVDYIIDAALDPDSRSIRGVETVTYHNNSPHTLDHIWLTLEQNLYRPDSLGALLTRPGARFGRRDPFEGGYTELSAEIDGRPAPIAVNDTVGRIDLPAPLAPGASVRFTVRWAFPVPRYGSDRMGYEQVSRGVIFQIAQWHPGVCVYDDVHGWNTLPYIGQGEFYSNFGTYDVSLTVPRSHIVAATGVLANPEAVLTPTQLERLAQAHSSESTVSIVESGDIGSPSARPSGTGPLTWRFRAEDVRGFAWASSEAFLWDACTAPGLGEGAGTSPGEHLHGAGTLCQSFYPVEAVGAWGSAAELGGSTQALKFCIDHYSRRWYPYPYPCAINVHGVVGGMEYPMVAFCGARDNPRELFGVTSHEIGHTWFPMIVNTNERLHAWMDEGFNTFINYYCALDRFPDDMPYRGSPAKWGRDQPTPMPQPIDIPADRVAPGMLGTIQYAKTAAGLVLLRESILGPERFDAAFRAYIRTWAGKSPYPSDFYRTMEDVSGEDLSWFWSGWFNSTGVLDQAVVGVNQPEGDGRNCRVTFTTRGGLVMPLVYRVTYSDGATETRTVPVQAWFDADTWTATWDTRSRAVREVVVDPNDDFPDVNRANNTWKR